MTKLFMKKTKLEEYEKMMVEIPNFDKRKISNEKLKYELSISCKDCKNYSEGRCKLKVCEYIIKNIKEGIVDYEYILNKSFKYINCDKFKERISKIEVTSKNNIFLNEEHKLRFYEVYAEIENICEDIANEYISAIYLLSFKENLWQLFKKSVCISRINFLNIKIKNLNVDEYVLYRLAKTIYTGNEYISIDEILDENIVNDGILKIIINGILIKRYGYKIIN